MKQALPTAPSFQTPLALTVFFGGASGAFRWPSSARGVTEDRAVAGWVWPLRPTRPAAPDAAEDTP